MIRFGNSDAPADDTGRDASDGDVTRSESESTFEPVDGVFSSKFSSRTSSAFLVLPRPTPELRLEAMAGGAWS